MIISPGTSGNDFTNGAGVFPDAQGSVWYQSCLAWNFLGLFVAHRMCEADGGTKKVARTKIMYNTI